MNSLCLWSVRKKLIALVSLAITIGIIVLYNTRDKNQFAVYSAAGYAEDCFDNNLKYGIEYLKQNIFQWSLAKSSNCKASFDKFNKLFNVDIKEGKLYFPPKFTIKVKEWLGHDNKLFEETELQKVTHVYHKLSHKLTAYNPLRAKRPISKMQKSSKLYLQELINKTLPGCDFCNAKVMTAEEAFGRVRGKYSISAANTFKIDKWHGLFIPIKHSILDINIHEFLDLFNTSLLWFKTVASFDRNAQFPILFWDMFPGAGASQVHVHVHGILGDGFYRGALNEQLRISNEYFTETRRSYWTDLVEVHDQLGLAVHFGKAAAITPLTSQKDHELMLISLLPTPDIYNLLYFVIQMYHNIDRYCYSSSMALPRVGYTGMMDMSVSLPTIITIGTRGQCPSTVNDVSSLELYTMFNINVDPYYTVTKLRQTISRLAPTAVVGSLVNLWNENL